MKINSLNKTTLVATLAMFVLAGLFYNDMQSKRQELVEKLDAYRVASISTNSYRNIDNDLALAYASYRQDSNGIYMCFDITGDKVAEYYEEYNVTLTPFGETLLLGNYLCPEKGSE